VLGGFTTFSAYIVDVQRALVAGAPRVALLYAAATLVAALAAAWTGVWLAALVFRLRAAGAVGDDPAVALGTGLCGTLTTYSTFGYETVTLYRSGARTLAWLYVAASVLSGFGAAYCGMAIAQAIH